MIILNTERLLLQHFHADDAEAMSRIFGDAEVMRFGDGIKTELWIRNWLRDCIENHYQNWGFGPWAVVIQSNQETIGYCGLFYFPDVCGQAEIEIGYRLAQAFWGNGYATEAVIAVRDYAFHTLNLQRLIAIIDPSNLASIRVIQKAGMYYEKEVMFEHYTHPDYVYAITHPSAR